jgi:hypothetical protein
VKQSERRAAADLLSAVTRGLVEQLEGAPVPVTRNRDSNLARLSVRLGVLRGLRLRHGDADLLSVHVVLDLVETVGAVLLPAEVGTPAEIASTGGNTIRVETSILVQRDKMRSVRGAKDVAAVATVVATQEDTEGGATGRRITIGRCRVSLKGQVSICMK